MLKNENIICISTIEWDFNWQGHQEIMSTFAGNGNRVLFIDNMGVRAPNLKDIPRLKKRLIDWLRSTRGFRQERENLYIYSPVVLPFPYSPIARWVNRRLLLGALERWMKVAEFHDPIIWTFLPSGTALDIINNIEKKLLVYYCIADFYELVDDFRKLKKTEDELVRKCNLIFAQGTTLAERFRKINDNVHIFPFGVKIDNFLAAKEALNNIPSDIMDINSPIIGYIGGIHRHIDFKLLRFIAEQHPDWSIVLIGPVQTDIGEISHLKNIILLGKKDFSLLPLYINRFDTCIIPYVKSEYTATVYPTKLNEYHALGKPVVSTDLPEIIKFNKENDNLVYVGRDYREFIDSIVSSITHPDVPEIINKRISLAKKNNWTTRIEEMSKLIEESLYNKSRISLNWSAQLKSFYKASRRKVLKIGFTALWVYLLLFYTPLIWFIAAPLKIVQPPQKADAIVVFAGGAGESGRPGQGYEERVQYATQLYNEGYAKHIIFSSGYLYAFREPLMMKALAVSLGVPEAAIILEDKAANTFENVKFSKEIINKSKWNKVILVSSPYHMLRASLVFNKIAPHITVVYSPIPRSIFYGYGIKINKRKPWNQINMQQIEGILHEYSGIVYYFLKGYI